MGSVTAARVDIIVPVYQEEGIFQQLYESACRSITADWRMLVVHDAPDDSTLTVARPIAARDPRVVLVLNAEAGPLGALKTGFRHAEAEAVVTVAADDPTDLQKIDVMTRLLYEGGYAVVVPSRYMRGGHHIGGPRLKRWMTRAAGWSLHVLVGLPVHDATNNFRMYRRSFLSNVKIESRRGFELAIELTVKAHLAGYSIVELPTTWRNRTTGRSKFKLLKWLPGYLRWYLHALLHAPARWWRKPQLQTLAEHA